MKLIIYDDKKNQRVYGLDKQEVRLGRSINNDICLENISISRNHAIFTKREDGFYIRDNNSKNGVIVNDQRVLETLLKDNDKIIIGSYELYFKDDSANKVKNERLVRDEVATLKSK